MGIRLTLPWQLLRGLSQSRRHCSCAHVVKGIEHGVQWLKVGRLREVYLCETLVHAWCRHCAAHLVSSLRWRLQLLAHMFSIISGAGSASAVTHHRSGGSQLHLGRVPTRTARSSTCFEEVSASLHTSICMPPDTRRPRTCSCKPTLAAHSHLCDSCLHSDAAQGQRTRVFLLLLCARITESRVPCWLAILCNTRELVVCWCRPCYQLSHSA